MKISIKAGIKRMKCTASIEIRLTIIAINRSVAAERYNKKITGISKQPHQPNSPTVLA